jgi:hypothetical protein
LPLSSKRRRRRGIQSNWKKKETRLPSFGRVKICEIKKQGESVTQRYRRHLYAHNTTARSTSMTSNNNNNNIMVSDDERKNFCPTREAKQRESTPFKNFVSMMKTLNKKSMYI